MLNLNAKEMHWKGFEIPPSHSETYIQRYSPLKKGGENQAGPLFTIVNCVDAWMIALELDHCVFTSLHLNDCISGCRYPNEMR